MKLEPHQMILYRPPYLNWVRYLKDKFEDYKEAIKNYEDLLNRYPHTLPGRSDL